MVCTKTKLPGNIGGDFSGSVVITRSLPGTKPGQSSPLAGTIAGRETTDSMAVFVSEILMLA